MYPKDPKTAQNLMKPLDVVIGRGGFPTGSWNFASLSFLTHVALSQEVFEHVSPYHGSCSGHDEIEWKHIGGVSS